MACRAAAAAVKRAACRQRENPLEIPLSGPTSDKFSRRRARDAAMP
jgi:hypothetical protein